MRITSKYSIYKFMGQTKYYYKTAKMPKDKRYRVGYINQVTVEGDKGHYRLLYTDGYKVQIHSAGYKTIKDAFAVGDKLLINGISPDLWKSNYIGE